MVRLLEVHESLDTDRVLLHLDIAEIAKGNDPGLHAIHARAASELATELDYPRGIQLANESLGFLVLNVGDFDRAESLFTLVLNYGRASDHPLFVCQGLDDLGILYAQKSELKKALSHFEEALTLKREAPTTTGLAASYRYLGGVYTLLGQKEMADSLIKISISAYQENKDVIGLAQAKIELAGLKKLEGNSHEATQLYLEVAKEMEGKNKAIRLLALVGYSHTMHTSGKLAEAIEGYGKAGELAKALARPLSIAKVKMNFGGLYQMSGQNDQSQLNYEQALTIYQDIAHWYGMADAYSRLSSLASVRGEVAESLRLNFLTLEALSKVDAPAKLSETNSSIAYHYIEVGESEKARAYLVEAGRLAAASEDLRVIGMYHLNSSLFHSRAGRIDSARLAGNEAINIFTKADDKDGVAFTHYYLYGVEKEAENFAEALDHFEKDRNLMDEMNSENARELIAQERASQNVADAEDAQVAAEEQAALLSERNRLYLFLGLALLGLLAVGSWFFFQLRHSKQQIEAQNLQLQQLNATKDKFFGIIAHDIRSPIVALDGVGEQMSYYLEKGKTDKLERLAGRVDSTAKRLSGLLDNLLNWALLQQGVIPYHPKTIDVAETGNHIFKMFRNNAELKNISLDLKVEDGLKVHADEAALHTILRNLVSNAIKFTPEGGQVSIGTESKGDKVFITVNDNGTGISAEKMKQLFTLETTSQPGTAGEKGTGLGLTLVKELAELNKGSLAVSSEPLRGSEFRVGLPLAA